MPAGLIDPVVAPIVAANPMAIGPILPRSSDIVDSDERNIGVIGISTRDISRIEWFMEIGNPADRSEIRS